ncbi:Epimerase family protein [compost metagenome]
MRVILFALENQNVDGPVNTTAPQPVTNAVFTKTLGRAIHRPTIFPMPGFAARLAFGEMADALLLSSARVQPARLEQEGFQFKHATLEAALKDILA